MLVGGPFGIAAAGLTQGGADRVMAFRDLERQLPRRLEAASREAGAQRAVAAFRAAVSRAESADALLSDPNARAFLAAALGVPEAAGQAALFRRAMLSDATDPGSLVRRLGDRRLLAAAQTLDFARRDLAVLREPAVLRRLEEGWVRQRVLDAVRERDPALVDALVFKEQAATVADSVYAVLGHPVVRRVVTTTLGLPPELAIQSVEAQARAVSARLDVSRLAEPRFVARFAERYLIAAPGIAAAGSVELSLLAPSRRSLLVV